MPDPLRDDVDVVSLVAPAGGVAVDLAEAFERLRHVRVIEVEREFVLSKLDAGSLYGRVQLVDQ